MDSEIRVPTMQGDIIKHYALSNLAAPWQSVCWLEISMSFEKSLPSHCKTSIL